MSRNQDRDARIIALRKQGWSNLRIAKEMDCSTGTVAGVCHRAKVKTPGPSVAILNTDLPKKNYPHASRNECAYPLGDPKKPNFRFCCKPAVPGKPYCATHVRVCYAGNSKPQAEADKV